MILCMGVCLIAGSVLPWGEPIQGETLCVDALASSITQAIEDAVDLQKAQNYMQDHLPQIRETVDHWIQTMGTEGWLDNFGHYIHRKNQEAWEKLAFFKENVDGEESSSFQIKFYFLDLLNEIEKFFSAE